VAVTGPDFISLQVRDLERSAAFYQRYLGLKRSEQGPPHAVVFGTKPIAFAVRDVAAGTDLDAIAQPASGLRRGSALSGLLTAAGRPPGCGRGCLPSSRTAA
jgi:catechol 2,3-dioxygenase-like lactoylglutathione lyase family enzyme